MKCYLVNLDRAPERLARMAEILAVHNIQFERISAIDGQNFSDEQLAEYRKHGICGYDLSRGDIACGATHLAIMQKVVVGGDDYAVIMEDDLHFSDDIALYLKDTSWIPEGVDIVKLETFRQETIVRAKKYKLPNGRFMSQLLYRHWGTGIYIISKESCLSILSKFNPGMECIDNYIFSSLLKSHNIYQIFPALAVQDGAGGFDSNSFLESDIHKDRYHYPDVVEYRNHVKPKKKGLEKIKHEVLRVVRKSQKRLDIIHHRIFKGQIKGRVDFKK